jgi:cyclopropane fatty-acyl-phospholipid synthase-like methyltransferase
MDWKFFWQQQGKQESPLLQVGRKGGQSLQEDAWMVEYAAYVANQLGLTKNDTLLDVCCGNGLLTHYLSKHCKAVLGVDFSVPHIQFAQAHYASETVQFVCVDALQLETLKIEQPIFTNGFTHASLCFSFQYFESVQSGLKVVQGVFKHTKGSLFLGDIPDREQFFVYYNSFVKLGRLLKQMLFQQNDMGKFWSENELDFIAKGVQRSGEKRIQPKHFPYAHYLMDYLISGT